MYQRTSFYEDVLKECFKSNNWYYYDYSNSNKATMKNNILTIDVPGFEKEDIDVYFENNLLTIDFKEDDVESLKYKITEGFDVESCTCKAGQIIIKFKKIEKKNKIVVE